MTRLVLWAHQRRSLVLVAAFGLLILSLAGMRGLTFDTDVLRLLPRDGRYIPSFRVFLERFGTLDHLYVVFTAPEGHSIRDYEEQIADWTERLRAIPEIDRVDTGTADETRNWSYVGDRQLLLLDDSSLTRALGRFRPDGMAAAVRESRELLAVPSPQVTAMVQQDPLGLFGLLREQMGDAGAGINLGLTEGGYVSRDGRQRLLIAHPIRPPYDTQFSHALFDRLAAVQEEARASARQDEPIDPEDALPPLGVDFAGGHRIAIETEAVVRRESITNGIGSLAMILPLLYFVFRSPWLVAIGAVPSALSLLVVLGLLGFTRATLSAAATGASAMLFGLGVDGVVLLYVAHRLALADGAAPDAAIRETAGPSSSMLLGMWTTAATFYGLMVVDFPSLEQLGRLIGHSMVACGILTLFIVPAMLPRRRTVVTRRLALPGLARFVRQYSWQLIIGSLVASIVLGIAATRLRVNPTLDRLRSVTPGAALEAEIGRAFGLPSDVFTIVAEGGDLETLLQENEALVASLRRDVPGVRVHAPTELLPSERTQAERARRVAAEMPAASVTASRLGQVGGDAGFRADTFAPFLERLSRLADATQRLTFDGYTAEGLGAVVGRFVVRTGNRWTLATYVFPPDGKALAAVEQVVARAGPAQRLTGLPLVNRELAQRFTPQFLRGLFAGSAIVVLLIVITFRNLKLSFLSLLPTAVGLLWAAGILGLAAIELDLFAVFAVLTFVGIGVDYGVHMIHRFQERGDAERACAELAPVILVAGAITLLGYGTLMTSSYPPLRSIGLVSVVSVVALIASSLFLLPALLLHGEQP